MEIVTKAINMKAFEHDPKIDDIYVSSVDGEEYLPPICDNIGRNRKLNDPTIVSNFASRQVD